ncbi:MAG: hypothetical protein Q9222_001295 [Ikaeria aurantiellina]
MDTSMLPPGVPLSMVPAGKPPPGVTPNLIDPPNLEAVTIGIGVLMIVLTAIVVSARLYTTFFLSRSAGWEDYSCICAVVSLYTYIGLVFYLNKFARHIWDVPMTWLDAAFFKQRFARDMFISPSTFFSKATILLLYLRLFRPTKWFRWTMYGLMTFMVALYGSYIIVNAALCAPAPGSSWVQPGVLAKCQKQEIYSVIQGTFNVVIDILILTLPIPIIMRMKMARNKKIGIMAIFGTGGIALICSLLSLAYRAKLYGSADWPYVGAENYIAIIVEIGITILCSCAPALFTLGRHLFQDMSLFASVRSRRNNTNRHTIPSGPPTAHSHHSPYIHQYSDKSHSDSSGTQGAVSSQHSSEKRKSAGYVELGEVGGGMSDTDRKLRGAAFGFDLDGMKPPPVRRDVAAGIMRTTDVEVVSSWEKRVVGGPKGLPTR